MTKKTHNSGLNSLGGIIGIIALISLGIFWIINNINSLPKTQESQFNSTSNIPAEQQSSSSNGDSSPFWNGTSTLQICKKPYYSTSECFFLTTKLLNRDSVQIYTGDGGSFVSTDLTCFKGGYDKDYIFCRSWDSSGQQWDILPSWVEI